MTENAMQMGQFVVKLAGRMSAKMPHKMGQNEF